MSNPAKTINLAEMSDAEVLNLDPSTLPADGEPIASAKTQSATGDDAGDAGSAGTGGAAADTGSSDSTTGGADSSSAVETATAGTGEVSSGKPGVMAESDQDSGQLPETPDTGKAPTGDVDYRAEFSKLMAPLKAAKREIKVDTADDARRLMQMGVDYSRKMEAMKPYQQVLKTLEKNNLLSIEKINFLIDLDKKNPEAVRKFLKDSGIDPFDLNLEGDAVYKPTDHSVSENEMALDDVIESIRGSTAFDKTVDVITKQWDTASKRILVGNPQVIRYINDHIEAGIFDKITARAENERMFGKHTGLSDLEVYKAVGDAMHTEGAFGATSASGLSRQGSSQDSGSGSSKEEDLRNRKRAAGSTKGTPSSKKQVPNFLAMSDADIEKFDIRSLNP